ncbi:RNA-binding S4 domain-containing protein [Arcanobacterium pinnipediorum]|uniref:RNA-binding S4 domain-containing protein n=1 Tax=Arcanobacterium pinnipediorum TaxID=1503041 RepID=A0ABY5AL77_9ACTO|nr:RNA-binding S4 domain-containing protein [Arcanobacterium pinnipediorum]USR79958.1 RNA-binding S4 domain-containing protein [Arcanobacterium pinnipediorum]
MSESVRIDLWLWSVRQTKTRSLATSECKAGHVRINGNVAKPSSPVKIGDEVRYRFQGFDRVLQVSALITKRTSATQAQLCYIDKSPHRPKVYVPLFTRERGTGRPTKKERRELDRIRRRDSNYGHIG